MLPPLAFGNRAAITISDPEEASETLGRIVPSIRVTPASGKKAFRTRLAAFALGDVRIQANAFSASRLEVDDSEGWHLIVHCTGKATLRCDGRAFEFHSGATAILLPNMRRSIDRGLSSVALAAIDKARLQRTVAALTGRADDPAALAERPTALPPGRVRALFAAFLQICGLIEDSADQPGLIEALGLDDLFYRWIAAALEPDEGDQSPGWGKRGSLDAVCDLMMSIRHRPLTLTEAAEISGLSARALQYAFKLRFGCSPMEWQRRERMVQAQARLANLGPTESITMVAYSMGFSSSAAFATHYRRYFGESPSQTVRRFR